MADRYRVRVYVSISRLRVRPERSDALVAAFRDRLHAVDEVDGFVDLQVWRSDRDPSEVLMVSRWVDRPSFAAYMRSDAHRRSHDRIDTDLKAAITTERLDHLHELLADADADGTDAPTTIEHRTYEVVAE